MNAVADQDFKSTRVKNSRYYKHNNNDKQKFVDKFE